MPATFPTNAEKDGALSGTGLAKESNFGVAVAANTFLPMTGNTMEKDPGYFSPTVMQGVRDKQIYNMQGEAKYAGAIDGPLFPSNAMELLVASIGADALPGAGVTGTTGTGTTTLGALITANTSAFTFTAGTGFSVGQVVQVDVNGTGPTTTAECRKIATLAGASGTVDQPWTYAHANGAAVKGVVGPYTHTVQEQNTLPSLTVEKNIGNFQSLQFAGCRVNKFDLKAPVGNAPVMITADMMGQSAAVLDVPTGITVVPEIPFVFTQAQLTIFGAVRYEVTNTGITIDNAVKATHTYSGFNGPSYLTPISLHTSGSIDLVFDSLDDGTYGDYTKMSAGTLGALSFSLTEPASGGSVTINMPQIALSKYANDLKDSDVVLSSLTYEASRPLSGGSQFTVQAIIVNSVYLNY